MASALPVKAMGARASSYLPYVCLQCQRRAVTAARQANPPLRTPVQSRRSASSVPFTERLRQKIWGTTAPPGPENPYGAPGTFEQHRKKNLEKRAAEAGPQEERIANKPTVIDEDIGSEVGGATTWEGMRVVGQKDYGLKEWNEEHPYQGYLENPRIQDKDMLVSIIHRALVEVMTLREANLPLRMRRDPFDPTNYGSAEEYEMYKYRVAQGATFSKSDDGEFVLVFKNQELEQTILDCIMPQSVFFTKSGIEEDESLEAQHPDHDQEQELAEDITQYHDQDHKQNLKEDPSVANAGEQVADLHDLEDVELTDPMAEEEAELEASGSQPRAYVPVDGTWRNLSLSDSEFKFAVLKRVTQLTGRRIPDPDIAKIEDAKGLFFHLVRKPKPKKLVQTLRTKQAVGLPNVELHGKRYTPIDKEKEIGRWKVIEQELKARGLPVTGKGTVRLGQRVD